MMYKRVRIALLACSLVAAVSLTVRADDKAPDKKPEPLPKPAEAAAPAHDACAPAAPAYKTICVTEWVPENYTATRTVYKRECVPEKYTAYRTECVAETKTRTVTCYRRVTEEVEELRTVCVCQKVQEERTVMKQVVTCVPVTTMVCKTVDKGHYECREVPCGPSFSERARGFLAKCRRHNDCGCEANCGCETECAAPRTKSVQVWVPCKETIQVPCTRMERRVTCVPEKVCVTVNKMVPTQQKVKVCRTRCIPETKTETYTCMVPKQVACEATRMVTRCVPVTETYTACRMVAKQVQKQVLVCPAPSPCETTCGCEEQGRLRGMLHRLHERGGHDGGCGCGCQ
jgi:hypothetical protein